MCLYFRITFYLDDVSDTGCRSSEIAVMKSVITKSGIPRNESEGDVTCDPSIMPADGNLLPDNCNTHLQNSSTISSSLTKEDYDSSATVSSFYDSDCFDIDLIPLLYGA